MKMLKPDSEEYAEKYAELDSLQELEKLLMNSLYGKLSESAEREVSNMITDDPDLILSMFSKG